MALQAGLQVFPYVVLRTFARVLRQLRGFCARLRTLSSPVFPIAVGWAPGCGALLP